MWRLNGDLAPALFARRYNSIIPYPPDRPGYPLMTRKKLPIGIQTFREIREDDCYYVDKTAFALKLIEEGKYYFLSRPRRFGKSLFLDTLAELFAGNEPLFRGLYAQDRWNWSKSSPVLRLSFGGGVLKSRPELEQKIRELLDINQAALGIRCQQPTISGCFGELIRNAHAATGERVVVLVDEYDKPILDNLTAPDIAREMREGLRNLYSVIKDSDAHLRFAFLTGVSKFSKVSLFSGLNNLNDITVDRELFGDLRLYRGGCRYRVRRRVGGTGSCADPGVVQRLQLDRRGGLQPLRSTIAVQGTPVQALVV